MAIASDLLLLGLAAERLLSRRHVGAGALITVSEVECALVTVLNFMRWLHLKEVMNGYSFLRGVAVALALMVGVKVHSRISRSCRMRWSRTLRLRT